MNLAPVRPITAAAVLLCCALPSMVQAQYAHQTVPLTVQPQPAWTDSQVTHCSSCNAGGSDCGCAIDWQAFAQGEYVNNARTQHVAEYRLRVDDQIAFVFRLTREESSRPYEFQVGDSLRVESLTGDSRLQNSADNLPEDDNIGRELIIQPDGSISLPLLGQVRAARMTVDGLRQHLEERYKKYYRVPAITVTPILINTKLQDLIATVDARQGAGGLQLQVQVTPAGKIYVPGLGSICVQGLTLEELTHEIDARYATTIPGVSVTPVLVQRAPRFVFVLGEVTQRGRFELTGPTTLMGALALSGGWNVGANLRQVVVFRRDENWQVSATLVNLRGPAYGRRRMLANDIWINDSDVIYVPKTPIQVADDAIQQYFTQGLYSLFPQFAFGQFNFDNFDLLSQ